MLTTFDRVDFAPPQPKASGKSFALAVVAHLALIAALTWGVNWHAEDNSGVEAELWSAVPQEAAPRLVTPDPTPPQPVPVPVPVPIPKVEPPPPEPKVDPVPNRDAQIAVEREKRKVELEKQEQARVQQAKADKAKQDKAREDQAKLDKAKLDKAKLDKAKQDKLKADQAKVEQAKQDAAEDKRRDLAKQTADAKRAAAAQEADRQKNLARIAGMAGASGGENARGNALQSSGPSAGYAGRIRARVKPNIVFTDDVDGNPTAEVEVRTAPDGTIVGQRLIKSSGSKSWDDAVVKAIVKTEILPRDTDGRVPSSLVIAFRPKD